MSNMGYCRFENTLADLQDCEEHMNEEVESEREKRAKNDLIELCKHIALMYDETI
jgi:hypothetical protein